MPITTNFLYECFNNVRNFSRYIVTICSPNTRDVKKKKKKKKNTQIGKLGLVIKQLEKQIFSRFNSLFRLTLDCGLFVVKNVMTVNNYKNRYLRATSR